MFCNWTLAHKSLWLEYSFAVVLISYLNTVCGCKVVFLLEFYCSSKVGLLLFSFFSFRNKEPVGTRWSCIYCHMYSSVGDCYFSILCCVRFLYSATHFGIRSQIGKLNHFPWELSFTLSREYFMMS